MRSRAASTQNLIEGNLIGTDKTGETDVVNKNEGILIGGAAGNTIGGIRRRTQRDFGQPLGVRIDGPGATGNLVVPATTSAPTSPVFCRWATRRSG